MALEEVAEDDVIPSELLKLVKKCNGTVHDYDDVAIPARDVDVDNAPASERF